MNLQKLEKIVETQLARAELADDNFAGWKQELAQAIKSAIDDALADGTVGMSMDNLFQVVRIPSGGPGGTNARYMMKTDWFPAALKSLPGKYQKFVR